jgi:hypothetical protein
MQGRTRDVHTCIMDGAGDIPMFPRASQNVVVVAPLLRSVLVTLDLEAQQSLRNPQGLLERVIIQWAKTSFLGRFHAKSTTDAHGSMDCDKDLICVCTTSQGNRMRQASSWAETWECPKDFSDPQKLVYAMAQSTRHYRGC